MTPVLDAEAQEVTVMATVPDAVNLVEELPGRIESTLSELLTGSSEAILVKLKGAFKEGLICTDTRVIILKGGFMTGQMMGTNAFQQPYSNISGVQVKWHLMSGYFELSAGGMQNTPKSYWSQDKKSDSAKAPNCISLNSKKQAERFRQACSVILAKIDERRRGVALPSVAPPPAQASPTSDALATLERLGPLRDAGVLSEEEFLAKKAELLSRL
jgi:hypothetical protein